MRLESLPEFRWDLQVGKCVFVFDNDDLVFGRCEFTEVGVVGVENFRKEFVVAEVGRHVGKSDTRGAGFEWRKCPTGFRL